MTAPLLDAPLLEVRGLSVSVAVQGEERAILRDVSFDLPQGAALGLVGESGSGKSMTARAITRLLPARSTVGGRIEFAGADVTAMGRAELAAYRRTAVAFVPQDPTSSVNPVHRVGDFLTESLRVVERKSAAEANAAAVQALTEVGISEPKRVMDQYPHQLSGGMLQRVVICAALLAQSRLIIADEPTTGLDVTTQADVAAILNDLRRDHGLSVLFITHDLELAAAVCDRIAVMYAGEIVEIGDARALETDGLHPYTQALFAARPSLDVVQDPLPAIPGGAVAAYQAPSGCAFRARCPYAADVCVEQHPVLERHDDQQVRCLRVDEIRAAAGTPGGAR